METDETNLFVSFLRFTRYSQRYWILFLTVGYFQIFSRTTSKNLIVLFPKNPKTTPWVKVIDPNMFTIASTE